MLHRFRWVVEETQIRRELIFLALAAATVVAATSPATRWAAAAVLLLAFVAFVVLYRGPGPVRGYALVVCAAAGLVSVLLAHNGVGEWPVLTCAAQTFVVFPRASGKVVTGLIAVGFGACIAWVTRSPIGLIAGLGVPILAQRRLDQVELEFERDRALRLLAELEAARDAQAQAAALEERGRIAREMHDVLAHSLAGLSLQLQAARAVATQARVAPAVMEPLDRAAELARSGLEEAKAAVGALRTPEALGISELSALVRGFPGDTDLASTGTPGALDPGAAHAVYRAVQECLTNAARYAPGSPIRVGLHWAEAALHVFVSDDGPADRVAVPGMGSGQGLRGMRERLAAVGGSVESGPQAVGWRTEITVPLESGSAEDAP